MSVLAFTYKDYYCQGIQASFRGIYESEDQVFDLVRGTRDDQENLEIMDADTFGVKLYRWIPEYEYREDYERYEPADPKSRHFLKHRWNGADEFEIFYDGPVRRFGIHNPLYYHGVWELDV